MTITQLFLLIVTQTAQVAGQLLLKRGMSGSHGRLPRIAGGIACLTFWFLAWLKLLQGLDISYLYPFEGLSLVGLVIAARVFLHEQTNTSAWLGVALIMSGMILVGLN
jgi:undecaprenyl phosphate-alpha-L-ara4N flippase subunit ArnE